jgi:hypothetical protein
VAIPAASGKRPRHKVAHEHNHMREPLHENPFFGGDSQDIASNDLVKLLIIQFDIVFPIMGKTQSSGEIVSPVPSK